MKIQGTSVLHADPEKVWAAITDPAVLASVIPGCQKLEPIAENHFSLTVSMGVAAIRGTYAGEVQLFDMTKPSVLTMRAAGAGGPGTIDTTVQVSLVDNGDGTTQLSYDATATVGGAAGGVGQRVLSSVAKKTAGLFFSAIDDVLTGKRSADAAPPAAGGKKVDDVAATAAAAGGAQQQPAAAQGNTVQGNTAQGSAPQQFGATLAPAAATGSDSGLNSLVYVVVGAIAALIGVMVGARIARR